MHNVIPCQRGKLPDDPSCEQVSHVGVEFEYVQGPHNQRVWRGKLAESGIYTWLTNVRVQAVRNGDYTIPTNPRTQIHSNVQRIYGDSYGHNGQARGWLSDAFPDQIAIGHVIRCNNRYTPDFIQFADRVLWEDSPPANRAFWDLTTDPTAGLELRSPPMQTDTTDHLRDTYSVFDQAIESLVDNGAGLSAGCSTHVHTDMSNMPRNKQGRIVLIYRLLERLMCAPLEPSRYFGGYNRPYFQNTEEFDTQGCVNLMGSENIAHVGRQNFLNTGALQEHGTFEWRHLEGVDDSAMIKAWVTLVMRFIQACTMGDSWNTKFIKMPILAVDDESVSSFLKFLDLERRGLSSELKDAKDWYEERRSLYSESGAYKIHLVEKGMSIKTLREDTVIPELGQFILAAQDESEETSNLELGKRFHQALLGVLSYETFQGERMYGQSLTSRARTFNTRLRESLIGCFGIEFADDYENGNFAALGVYIRSVDNFVVQMQAAVLRMLSMGGYHENDTEHVREIITGLIAEEEQCVDL